MTEWRFERKLALSSGEVSMSAYLASETLPTTRSCLLLRTGFIVAPILFGVDKFFNWMVTWERYLWPEVATWFNASRESVMDAVGVIEIAAGIMVLLAPRIGSLLVAGWLGVIITNLVAYGIDTDTEYWDIALRDFGLLIGAVALFLLANAYSRGSTTPVRSG